VVFYASRLMEKASTMSSRRLDFAVRQAHALSEVEGLTVPAFDGLRDAERESKRERSRREHSEGSAFVCFQRRTAFQRSIQYGIGQRKKRRVPARPLRELCPRVRPRAQTPSHSKTPHPQLLS